MKAAVNKAYGPAEQVVTIGEVARPEIAEDQVLVKVFATVVTTGQWRMVEMNAEGIMLVMARLIFGITKPRRTVQGGAIAGRVVSVGSKVSKFKLGDEVVGFVMHGAHAEYAAISENGALARKPENLGYDEAAALPFGGLSAMGFLRDFAKVRPGQRVLVTGASGGVGVYGVQIAKQMGAEVTGLTSTGNVELVHGLGADHVIDYTQTDFTKGSERFDVILDTAGVTGFGRAKRVLAPGGRFVPLEFGLREMLQALRADRQGRRVIVGVSGDKQEDLQTLVNMADRGEIRAVIDCEVPLARITEAYKRVASRHSVGAAIVNMDMPNRQLTAA